jgi:hypothetical protein
VISEGVNYQDFRKGLLCNGVQLTGFRFMGASQALISDNDACSFNPFPQYFHGKSYQRRKFLLFWCSWILDLRRSEQVLPKAGTQMEGILETEVFP